MLSCSLRGPGLIQAGSVKVLYLLSLSVQLLPSASSAGSLGSSAAHLHGKSKNINRSTLKLLLVQVSDSAVQHCLSVGYSVLL